MRIEDIENNNKKAGFTEETSKAGFTKETSKAGFVALIGRPNAGKSTLLNSMLGEKIAMVSHKANATRKRINAIVMHNDSQIIFTDTPGIHQKEKTLNKFMLEEAIKAMGDADVIVFLSPVQDSLKYYEEFLELNKKNTPHIVALTKIDQASNEKILKKIAEFSKYSDKFEALIPVSSKKKLGYKDLLDEIEKLLPASPYLFDPDDLTNELLRNIYKEFIREAIFENISDEVPYESDVIIEKIYEERHIDKIYATIIVEKNSQKGIIIGKSGEAIKRIGRDARKKIEELNQKKVFLDLEVVVKKGWSKNKQYLEELGYKQ